MARTPPELKWLAEKRARVAHTLLVAAERARLAGAAVDELTLDLAALDRSIKRVDAGINPERIGAVNGWKGKYGALGGLRAAIVDSMREAGASWLSSTTIEKSVVAQLGLVFETPPERERWYVNSFANALSRLSANGTIERRPVAGKPYGKLAHWRITQHCQPTLADLRARAAELL